MTQDAPDADMFALEFEQGAVRLHVREADAEWRRLGEAAPDAPDFTQRVEKLRARGARIAGAAAETEPRATLWLPPELVFLTRLRVGAKGPEVAARTALAERFGDAVETLVWDVGSTGSDGRVALAACEKRTVAEARAHARRFGFAPGRVTLRAPVEGFAQGPALGAPPGGVAAPVAESRGARRRWARPAALAAGVAAMAVAAALWTPGESPPDPITSRLAQAPKLDDAAFSEPQPDLSVADMRAQIPPEAIVAPSFPSPAAEPPRASRLSGSPPRQDEDFEPDAMRALIVPSAVERPAAPPVDLPATPPVPPDDARLAFAASASPVVTDALPGSAAPAPPPEPPSSFEDPVSLAQLGGPPGPHAPAAAPSPPLRAPADEPPPTTAADRDAAAPLAAAPSGPTPQPPRQRPASALAAAAAKAAALSAPRPTPRPVRRVDAQAVSRASVAVASRSRAAGAAARAATLRDALPFGQTALIGVFVGPDGRAALLRLSSGEMRRVSMGSRVEGWTVSEIDETALRLRKGAQSKRLVLPKP